MVHGETPSPLTPAQLEVWLGHLRNPDSATSNIGEYFEVHTHLNPGLFEQAVRQVVAEMEVLRVQIGSTEPEQRVLPELDFSIAQFDFRGAPDGTSKARQWMRENIQTPFSFEAGPLFRFALFLLDEETSFYYHCFHHIILDGYSVMMVGERVAEIYSSSLDKQPVSTHPFGNYPERLEIDQSYYTSASFERDQNYWGETLKNFPPPVGLKSASKTIEVPFFKQSRLSIPRSIAAKLTPEGTSLTQVITAAAALHLHQASGKSEITIGLTVSGRSGKPMRTMPGTFANTVPLRLQIGPASAFNDFAKECGGKIRSALKHQRYRIEQIERECGLRVGQSELYRVSVNVIPQDRQVTFGDQRAISHKMASGPIENLVICGFDFDHSIDFPIDFQYNPSVYSESEIQHYKEQFYQILEQIASGEILNRPIRGEEKFPGSEPKSENNATTSGSPEAVPEFVPLVRLFERRVEMFPAAIALEDKTREFSYAEVNRKANQVARYLQQSGVRPESIVGLLVERKPESIIAILAVLKTGAAYLPMDSGNPDSRLQHIVTDAQISQLIVSSSQSRRINIDGLDPIVLEASSQWSALSDTNLTVDPEAENSAYIIYTSGTTGTPKGVTATHQNLSHTVRWVSAHFEYTPESRVLQFNSLSFDVSVEEICAALISGSTLYCATEMERYPGPPLIELLEEKRISHLSISPSAMAACEVKPLPDLKKLILGGEACPPDLARQWARTETRLINAYGPTETTMLATCDLPLNPLPQVTIGKPVGHYQIYVFSPDGQPVNDGESGELYIGGCGLTRGYLHRPGLTAEHFLPNPFTNNNPGERIYRTGDLGRILEDGRIVFEGRADRQVQVRGFRIELQEINSVLRSIPTVPNAEAICLQADDFAEAQIIGFVTGSAQISDLADDIRQYCAQKLPSYMVPSHVFSIPEIPLTPSGKADYTALEIIAREKLEISPQKTFNGSIQSISSGGTGLETHIADIWKEVLARKHVDADSNFFDLGGHSLQLVKVHQLLKSRLGISLKIVDLFGHPTIRSLAHHLSGEQNGTFHAPLPKVSSPKNADDRTIAIVGMAGRFPGAENLEQFWANLAAGVESITHYSEEELRAAGLSDELIAHPRYVPFAGAIKDIEYFDAKFFGISPREAELTDPQHRIFLELAWHALEHGGYDPARYAGEIGVFAGVGINTYLLENLRPYQDKISSTEGYGLALSNDKDYVPTRVSYKLGLRGPSINVNTACSTSLVAVHLARQALLTGDCDMALAGGISVSTFQQTGYLHQESSILSPDGHCRAFSSAARGTVGSSGAGIVLLKPLSAALEDRDTIYGVIKGSAINNDGATKVGYTAPSVEGQALVIRKALKSAGIRPDQIDYVEAHGTGTELGDPIEIAALTQAFSDCPVPKQSCRIGSVKTNLGHTDNAAGLASLIKCTLSLIREKLPPSLHCEEPNPEIDFPNTPFRVNQTLQDWKKSDRPRYCGISTFGIGGTNAHLILGEAPEPKPSNAPSAEYPIVLSAKTPGALKRISAELIEYLDRNPNQSLADLSFTLAVGRGQFDQRRGLVAENLRDLRAQLEDLANTEKANIALSEKCVFMFPGQGTQFSGMTHQLYQTEASYRRVVDQSAEFLLPLIRRDIRSVLFETSDGELIHQTQFTQPCLFVTQYALARLWISRGVVPAAMIGHSIGEYTAACLAGVFSFEEALKLVAYRGQVMQKMAPGSMLAVPLSPDELSPLLSPGKLDLSAHNGQKACMVGGTMAAIEEFRNQLAESGIRSIEINTSHAFHTPMMEAAAAEFAHAFSSIQLKEPNIPFASNLTGTWTDSTEAKSTDYWCRQIREPVRFHEGLSTILEAVDANWIEVGSGKTLRNLVRRHPKANPQRLITDSLPPNHDNGASDTGRLIQAMSSLWEHGVSIDWNVFFNSKSGQRIALPLYPFERQRFWIDPVKSASVPPPETRYVDEAIETEKADDALQLSETEETVAGIWKDLLGIQPASPYDDFFELGGESLLGVQLISRIRDAFQVQLTLEELANTRTLEQFAELIEDKILQEIESA